MRFVLNKADSVELQELMRVYGAFFWNLAPLINVTEPPRVYVGSFHSSQFRGSPSNHELFRVEEIALLQHLHDVIFSAVQNKVAVVRQHTLRVLLHAEMVTAYIKAFEREKSFFFNNDPIWSAILSNPERYQFVLSDRLFRFVLNLRLNLLQQIRPMSKARVNFEQVHDKHTSFSPKSSLVVCQYLSHGRAFNVCRRLCCFRLLSSNLVE